jgi:hypothetical protein
LAGLLAPHYAWPEGFRNEEKYDLDPPLIVHKDSPYYNLNKKCETLMNYTQEHIDEEA